MSIRFHQQIDLFLLRALPTGVGTVMCSHQWWPATNVVTLALTLLACSISLCSYTYKSSGHLQH